MNLSDTAPAECAKVVAESREPEVFPGDDARCSVEWTENRAEAGGMQLVPSEVQKYSSSQRTHATARRVLQEGHRQQKVGQEGVVGPAAADCQRRRARPHRRENHQQKEQRLEGNANSFFVLCHHVS